MKYQINVELSQQGIQHVMDVLQEYSKRLPLVSKTFIQYSLDFLENLAKENIDNTTGSSEWYQVTGTLKHSFTKQWSNFYGELINHAMYACYVEFGTGEFASKGDGRQGGWLFKDKDGVLRFTHGTKPHFFMQNAIDVYLSAGTYKTIWDKAFNDVMGEVLK